MIASDEKVWLTSREVAARLGVSRQRVEALDHALRPVRTPLPSGRTRRAYLAHVVEAYAIGRDRRRIAKLDCAIDVELAHVAPRSGK